MKVDLTHLDREAKQAVKTWHRSSLARTGTTERDHKTAVQAVAAQLNREAPAKTFVQGRDD